MPALVPSARRARRLAALVPLVLGVALLAACSGDGGGEERDLSAVDAHDLLATAADRFEGAESFHVRVEHENGSTPIIAGLAMTSAEGDYAGSDRVRLEISARAFGNNIATGIVILPEAQYFRNPLTGNWVEQDISLDQVFDPSSGVTALMRGVTDAEAVNTARIDGVETYVLEATVDSGDLGPLVPGASAGREVLARVWVGIEDRYPYRAELVGPVTGDDGEDILRRVHLSDFNEPVEIEAPE